MQVFADGISYPDTALSRDVPSRKLKKTCSRPLLGVFCVLYGPPALFESVGTFVARCNLYLQHPAHCDRNVPYRNPHCLSPTHSSIYTHDLNDYLNIEHDSRLVSFQNPIDLFADASEREALVESDTPQALRTDLYQHQKQALTFMVQRERGWAFNEHFKDIWKEDQDACGRRVYLNTISGQKQPRAPKQFRGGLLIDAPGLGKSLSIIALVAFDDATRRQMASEGTSLSTTLLVVPKTCKLMCDVRHRNGGSDLISDSDLAG